jgi:hypothetical protein
LPPLCHSVLSVVFQNLKSKISKSLMGFSHCGRDGTQRPNVHPLLKAPPAATSRAA